jgi:hypothetical protein
MKKSELSNRQKGGQKRPRNEAFLLPDGNPRTKEKGNKSPESTMPAKQKCVVPAKHEHAGPSYEATLEARTRHWTQWIEPKGAALISEMLLPCHFVVKNYGPETLRLVAVDGDLMDLPPGTVRATYAKGTVRVENRGEKSVLIEFEFYPIYKK